MPREVVPPCLLYTVFKQKKKDRFYSENTLLLHLKHEHLEFIPELCLEEADKAQNIDISVECCKTQSLESSCNTKQKAKHLTERHKVITCVFLYSISCDRPNTAATAPPPRIAVRFRAFLNAILGPTEKVKCSEET